MNITDLTKVAGKKSKGRRVGRGPGSGAGKTASRGHDGCGSRAGWSMRGMAEGGQMPLFRRIPKRGFNNANFRHKFSIVNLSDLESRFDGGTHVTVQVLLEAGLVRNTRQDVKVLGDGELTKKLVVEASKFSKSAAEKIAKAGGEARVV